MKRRILAMAILVVLLCGTVFVNAAIDPDVSIVSPGSTVYGNSLLISVKVTAPKTIKVFLYEEKEKIGDTLISINPEDVDSLETKTIQSVSVMIPETYVGTGSLQFFNKQITDLPPALYRIKVETIDSTGTAIAASSSRVAVIEGIAPETNTFVFQTQPSGALQWVQNLLKSIFGN